MSMKGMPLLQAVIEQKGFKLNKFAENVLGMSYLQFRRRLDSRSFKVDEISALLKALQVDYWEIVEFDNVDDL